MFLRALHAAVYPHALSRVDPRQRERGSAAPLNDTPAAVVSVSDRARQLATPDGSPATDQRAGGQRPEVLDEGQRQQVRELSQRDAEVRTHEMAHKGAAGGHAGAISYSYQLGPDGKRYAVGGEVPLDVSVVRGSPEQTARKMDQIVRAALAPLNPSAADRQIAARAAAQAQKARAESVRDTGARSGADVDGASRVAGA
jgi:hypothetical protein